MWSACALCEWKMHMRQRKDDVVDDDDGNQTTACLALPQKLLKPTQKKTNKQTKCDSSVPALTKNGSSHAKKHAAAASPSAHRYREMCCDTFFNFTPRRAHTDSRHTMAKHAMHLLIYLLVVFVSDKIFLASSSPRWPPRAVPWIQSKCKYIVLCTSPLFGVGDG